MGTPTERQTSKGRPRLHSNLSSFSNAPLSQNRTETHMTDRTIAKLTLFLSSVSSRTAKALDKASSEPKKPRSGKRSPDPRALVLFVCLAAMSVFLCGCGSAPLYPPDYYFIGLPAHHEFIAPPARLQSPRGLFPYGSAVSCPQVSVGRGLARCQ